MSAVRVDDRAYAAAQDFLLGTKTFWTTRMFPALRAEYETRSALQPAPANCPAGHSAANTALQSQSKPALQTAATDCAQAAPHDAVREVAVALCDAPLYQTFAWFERHLQRMKYSGRFGLVNWHARDRERIAAALADAPAVLDAAMEYPRYYTSVDIHQHPGGLWSDAIAGAVYERGARSTTPLAGQQHADLHERFTQQVARLFVREEDRSSDTPQTLLDMGCGFGKSTLPFARAFANARIEAIDLAAPCLRLAASTLRDARRAGQGAGQRDAQHRAQLASVRFAQVNAAHTRFAGGEFDLVTSTMLLHELPPPVVKEVLCESARLLKPGGWMAHLDFLPQAQPGADAFSTFIHYGHGRRNNEPFMEPLANMDLATLLAGLGFTDVAIEAFEEAPGALDAANRDWRFPWAVIRARKAGASAAASARSTDTHVHREVPTGHHAE